MNAPTMSSGKTAKNIFAEYFNQALNEKVPQPVKTGPYISISRDFGCLANPIAQRLETELNRINLSKGFHQRWKWLNKEILTESSKALELSPSKIEYVFKSKQRSTFDEVIEAMSTRYYKSDKKIRSTILNVIRSVVKTGNVIIVGRGGVAFAKDNPRSIHIKLIAPLEWRLDRICDHYRKSRGEALRNLLEVDKERKYLIDSFMGYETDESIFDLILNRKTLTEDEIVSVILNMASTRGLIGTY